MKFERKQKSPCYVDGECVLTIPETKRIMSQNARSWHVTFNMGMQPAAGKAKTAIPNKPPQEHGVNGISGLL